MLTHNLYSFIHLQNLCDFLFDCSLSFHADVAAPADAVPFARSLCTSDASTNDRRRHTHTDIRKTSAYEDNRLDQNMSFHPYFDFNVPKNITARVGQSAFLNCRVEQLGDKSVSRHKIKAKCTHYYIIYNYMLCCC